MAPERGLLDGTEELRFVGKNGIGQSMTIRQVLHTSVALAFVSAAIAANAATMVDAPIELQPVGPWQLDMAENKWRMARAFGSEDEKTLFLLEQWDPSAEVGWIVTGPAVGKFKNRSSAVYAFGPGGDADKFDVVASTFGDFGTAVRSYSSIAFNPDKAEADERNEDEERDYAADPRGLPHLDADGAEGITYLDIGGRTPNEVRLLLGDMKKPLEAMNICMANLVEHWGFDVEEQRSVVTPPKPRNLDSVTRLIVKEYPLKALRRGAQADFHLRLTVDPDGSVSHCAMINQTTADNFDPRRHPCTIFTERAEFEPATDAGGKALPSFYNTRILYRIPV